MLLIADPINNWGTNRLVDFLALTPSLTAQPLVATKIDPEFHLDIAFLSAMIAAAGGGLALFLYLGQPREAHFLKRVLDLEDIDWLTDPQWVTQLERVWWIGGVTRFLRRIHLGWIVAAIGYALGLAAIVLSVPLVIGRFLTPYRLSYDKFYFDELYAALVVWPLRILAAACAWLDRWIIDGLVNWTGRIPAAVGALMRPLQMGLLQFYALAMVLGMLILVAARLIWAAA
jgi:NADH-quinone oxidoreductase subunit L